MGMLKRAGADFSHGFGGFYHGKSVAITGAAGTIGSALAEEIVRLDCRRLLLLDHIDHGLLDIVERVERLNRRVEVIEALCDIRDRERLALWFERVRPDIVIHAAALKHVHFGERHPGECLMTNLVGVRNALASAHAAGAKHFTLVSSDKAASPVCVMGATKRLAELHLLDFQREHGRELSLKAVRFGNVIGSQGSVLPRFSSQILAGGPLEITHPEMERFFMSIGEAVGLILNVTRSEDGSGSYFMEMGDPVSILELGREMIANSGRKVDIEFIGLRPGEKISEEFFDAQEVVGETSLAGLHKITPRSAGAPLSSREIDQLEHVARFAEDEVVRRRVFACLDMRIGREVRAAI